MGYKNIWIQKFWIMEKNMQAILIQEEYAEQLKGEVLVHVSLA